MRMERKERKGWDARVMGRTGRGEWTKMVGGKEGLERVERRNREGGRERVGRTVLGDRVGSRA